MGQIQPYVLQAGEPVRLQSVSVPSSVPEIDAQGLRVEYIESAERFVALRPDWQTLEDVANGRASAGFVWALTGWQNVAQPAGGLLCVIAIWRGARLEAVWGLACYQRMGLRVLRPLGGAASEYSEILARPDMPDTERLVALLVRSARSRGDCIELQHVDPTGLAARFCAQFPIASTRDPIQACYLELRGFASIEAYRATRNKTSLRKLDGYRRALCRIENLKFSIEEDLAAKRALIDWLLTEKSSWIVRNRKDNPWIGRESYRDFLHALINPSVGRSPLLLVRLSVEEQTIAACMFSIDRHMMEWILGAYDPHWSHYSPSNLLILDCIAWAQAHGLDFDFRIGGERYKRSWANREIIRHSHFIALTPKGLIPVLREGARLTYLRMRGRCRRGLGFFVGRIIKPFLAQLPQAILPRRLRQATVK